MLIFTFLVVNCACDLIGRREETEKLIGGEHDRFTITFYTVVGILHYFIFRDNITGEINDALSNQIEY
jgi:hypothetical protein